jgi:hypothetical protein
VQRRVVSLHDVFLSANLSRLIAGGAQSADDLWPTILLRTIVVGREPCKRLLMRVVKSSVQLTTLRVPRRFARPSFGREAAITNTLGKCPCLSLLRHVQSRKPTDRRHKSESLAAKCEARCVRHPAFNQKSKIINQQFTSSARAVPRPRRSRCPHLLSGAKLRNRHPQSLQREIDRHGFALTAVDSPPLEHGHPGLRDARGYPPPPGL